MPRGKKISTVKSVIKSPTKVKLNKKEIKDLEKRQREEEKVQEKNFNENLIAAINCRSFIYDREDPNHDRKRLINKAWEEIAGELGREVSVCHTRWRSLKDTFNRRYEDWKSHPSGQGSDESHMPTWPWFESLLFLKEVNHPEKTIDTLNLSPTTVDDQGENSDEDNNTMQQPVTTTNAGQQSVPSVSESLKRTKRKKSSEQDVVLDKLEKLIDQQCVPEKQTKSGVFFQYLEMEMTGLSEDDEEDFIDSCVDKLREIKRRRKQKRQVASQSGTGKDF